MCVSGHVGMYVHHCRLLLLSVPLGSPMFMRPIDRPTLLTASRRGGILSLIRSRPLASSKLLIRCCGENPRMAAETHTYTHQGRSTHTCTVKSWHRIAQNLVYPNPPIRSMSVAWEVNLFSVSPVTTFISCWSKSLQLKVSWGLDKQNHIVYMLCHPWTGVYLDIDLRLAVSKVVGKMLWEKQYEHNRSFVRP